MKKISILGSTGSIGTQALEVCTESNELEAVAICANSNVSVMEQEIRKYKPRFAALLDEKSARDLEVRVKDTNTIVRGGESAIEECATYKDADTTLASIVGIAGLKPTISAIKAGKNIALANKETLVTAGDIVKKLVKEHNVSLLPVDSEHSAIFQSIGRDRAYLKKILLTASGGPFFGKTKEELADVKKEDALKHPNWSMGSKITIDSATLVNKGLEVIEAMHLFDVSQDDIEVVIHRESIVHSLVEFCDNSVIGQLGYPSMKLPISYALHYPERKIPIGDSLDLKKIGKLTFYDVDSETFPAIELAKKAARIGGTMPCVFNGANEKAVFEFLHDKCKFLEICERIERVMDNHKVIKNPTLDDIIESDLWARKE